MMFLNTIFIFYISSLYSNKYEGGNIAEILVLVKGINNGE